MSSWFRKLTLSMIIGVSLVALGPASVQADDYWDGYWGWYDNSYRPYYYRQYYYPGRYSGSYMNYGPYYGGGYYAPRARYYGAPGVGVYDYGVGRAGVQVGPLRFGWR